MPRFALRNALQRLIGPTAVAYLLHLRPLEWPIMTAHMLLGTFLAVGRHLPPRTFAAWAIFVVLMNGGTLALNSAFDQDEGDIGYLRQPPKPPKHLAAFGYALLALSLAWAFTFARQSHGGKYYFEIVMTCVLMSVLYSVPPIRLKARAGWDLLINCVGFGFFTPLAGWTFTGRGLEPMIMNLCVGFGLLFAALYPLTQIYQVEEDSRRGDSTLVIRIGVGRSLTYALIAAVGAHLWFVKACLLAKVSALPLLISLAAWIGLLLPWRLTWEKWDPAKAEGGMYRGLWAWAITDISILILLWPKG
jgi:4-hydroxybenzoate polyprenyltransferase